MVRTVHPAPNGEVAIIFSDVQDSTVLWDRAAQSMQAALELHDKLLAEVIADFGCYQVKNKGDAFMIAAPDATTALKLCFEAQGERGTKRKVVSSHPFKVLSKFHDASPPGARRVVSRPSRGR